MFSRLLAACFGAPVFLVHPCTSLISLVKHLVSADGRALPFRPPLPMSTERRLVDRPACRPSSLDRSLHQRGSWVEALSNDGVTSDLHTSTVLLVCVCVCVSYFLVLCRKAASWSASWRSPRTLQRSAAAADPGSADHEEAIRPPGPETNLDNLDPGRFVYQPSSGADVPLQEPQKGPQASAPGPFNPLYWCFSC